MRPKLLPVQRKALHLKILKKMEKDPAFEKKIMQLVKERNQ